MMFLLLNIFNIVKEVMANAIKKKKEVILYKHWKVRHKTVIICRHYDNLPGKSMKIS